MKSETKRLIAAGLGVPLLYGGVSAIAGALLGGGQAALYLGGGMGAFMLLAMLFVGLPQYFILKTMGRTGWLSYALMGALGAVIILAFNREFIGLQIQPEGFPYGFITLYSFIPAGILTALLAWAIVRPDKSAAGRY